MNYSKKMFNVLGTNTVILVVLSVSQILFEFFSARYTTVDDFESYVFFRNLIIPIVSLSSLGLNDTIARHGNSSKAKVFSFAKVSFFVIFFLSSIFSFSVYFFSPSSKYLSFFVLMATCLFLGWGQTVAAVLRCFGSYAVALLFRDGWRLILWLSFPLYLNFNKEFPFYVFLSISLTYSFFVFIFFCLSRQDLFVRSESVYNTNNKDFEISFSFWLNAIIIVGFSYLDQIILSYLVEAPGLLKEYAVLSLFVVSPFLLLSTTFGFILLPTIAKSAPGTISPYREIFDKLKKRFLLIFLIFVLVGVFYYFLLRFIFHYIDIDTSFSVFFLLYLSGIFRLIYTIPSSYVGAKGSCDDINKLTAFSFVILTFQVVFIIILYEKFLLVGVALATVFSWIFRTLTSWKFMKYIESR